MAQEGGTSLGQKAKDAATIAEAIAEDGVNVAKDLQAVGAAAREAKPLAKGLGVCCIAEVFMFFFVTFLIMGVMNPDSSAGELANNSGGTGTSACGLTVDTLVPGINMLPRDGSGKHISEGKMGNEQHLDNTKSPYWGSESGSHTEVHTSFVTSHTSDQEHWYMNARWVGWTLNGMSKTNKKGDSKARDAIRHAKVVVTLEQPGKPVKSIITSVEEFGPNPFKSAQDGIEFGSPPEVRHALGQSDANTGNPSDKKGLVKIAFAADQQSAKLGPCK